MEQKEFNNFTNDILSNAYVADRIAGIADDYLSDGLKSFSVTRDDIANNEKVRNIINGFCTKNNYTLDDDIYKALTLFFGDVILKCIKDIQAKQIRQMLL